MKAREKFAILVKKTNGKVEETKKYVKRISRSSTDVELTSDIEKAEQFRDVDEAISKKLEMKAFNKNMVTEIVAC